MMASIEVLPADRGEMLVKGIKAEIKKRDPWISIFDMDFHALKALSCLAAQFAAGDQQVRDQINHYISIGESING